MKAIKELPAGARLFFNRCRLVPFETAISLWAIYAGMASFLNWTVASRALSTSFPSEVTQVLNLIYLVSGVLIFLGVGWAYRNVEVSGLILLASSFAIRIIVLLSVVGLATPEAIGSMIQGLTFGLACIIRAGCLLKNHTLVFASDIPEIIARQSRAQGIKP